MRSFSSLILSLSNKNFYPASKNSFFSGEFLSVILYKQMGQLLVKFKEWREKLELSHEKAKHGKYFKNISYLPFVSLHG